MQIEILQWNISYNCQVEKISELLKNQISHNSIVCLQEVMQSIKDKLVNILKPTDYSFSLDIRPPGKFDGKNRKLGVLTMTFGGKIIDSHLVARSVFPERTLVTKIKYSNNQNINILNFHSLTGVGYKKSKASNFASIAEYLEKNNLDFFCCDANEPKTDSFQIENLEFWDNGNKGKYPSLIFGVNKVHDLDDSVYSIVDKTTELPISYKTGKTFRRYDLIFKSKKWAVKKLEYMYKEGIEATSDHALVKGKYKSA